MEAPNMGSPRLADCADLCCPLIIGIIYACYFTHSSGRYLITKLANLSTLLTINANFMLEYVFMIMDVCVCVCGETHVAN